MQHIIKRLREDSDYQGFFLKTLHDFNKKFGTTGVSDMTDSQKKAFFDYVEKTYKKEPIKEGTMVNGTIELTFTADVLMSDPESIKNHIATYLDNLLKREKKYTFRVAKGVGGSPNIKFK